MAAGGTARAYLTNVSDEAPSVIVYVDGRHIAIERGRVSGHGALSVIILGGDTDAVPSQVYRCWVCSINGASPSRCRVLVYRHEEHTRGI
jgi:hypothetical protein